MDDKTKQEVKDMMGDVINEVVVPALETLATKEDVRQLIERMDKMDARSDRIERKLDIFSAQVSQHDVEINNIEKQLKQPIS